jgi:Xaa-Pro aminopeptidase
MEKRIEKLRKDLQKGQAMLIFNDINRFYFTGMRSSAGVLVITSENAVLLIDFRYFEKAKGKVKCAKTILCVDTYKQIFEILAKEDIKEIFLETDSINLAVYSKLKENLNGIEVLSDSKMQKLINTLRSVKSEEEIEYIKKAQKITDKTFAYILDKIKPGKTEKEIALEMEFFARKNGSDGIAFDFIVVSGKNSSLPHGVPTNKPIENGYFNTMDFGASVNGS